MKKLLFLLVCMVALGAQAQVMHTLSATKEVWAAGACCSNGTYYHFTWRYFGSPAHIRLDSMYIEGVWYEAPSVAKGTLRIDTAFTGATYTALVNGPSRSVQRMYQPPVEEDEGPELTLDKPVVVRKPPRSKGDAVLVYRRGDQRFELAIPQLELIYSAAKP